MYSKPSIPFWGYFKIILRKLSPLYFNSSITIHCGGSSTSNWSPVFFAQLKGIIFTALGFSKVFTSVNFAEVIRKGEVYINLMEDGLVLLIEKIIDQKLKIGKEVGVISYNETALKKIILNGITSISTDFQMMGEKAAELVLNKSSEHIEARFYLTLRNSLWLHGLGRITRMILSPWFVSTRTMAFVSRRTMALIILYKKGFIVETLFYLIRVIRFNPCN